MPTAKRSTFPLPHTVEAYRTSAIWVDANDHVLVMCCTDPRFQQARREFIEEHLGLTRYDPIIGPGGPACILPEHRGYRRERSDIVMLHRVHGFRRVIAFAHRHCRFYRMRYPRLNDMDRRFRQLQDLQRFRSAVVRMLDVPVEIYYAELIEGRVRFLEVK